MTSHGSIEPDKDNIREEPYSLPQGFGWDTLDLGNPSVVRVHKHTHCQPHPHEELTFYYQFPGLTVCKINVMSMFRMKCLYLTRTWTWIVI